MGGLVLEERADPTFACGKMITNRLWLQTRQVPLRTLATRAYSRSVRVGALNCAAVFPSASVSRQHVACPTFVQFRSMSSSLPPHQVFGLPAQSPTMTTGSIVEWFVKEGDSVEPGQRILNIETDKATIDVDSMDDAFVARILVPAPARDIPIHHPIAVLVFKKEHIAAFKDFVPPSTTQTAGAPPQQQPTPPPAPTPVPQPAAPTPAPTVTVTTPTTTSAGGRIFVSPLARKAAAALNVKLSEVKGRGPNGRIIHQDILDAAQQQQHQVAQPLLRSAAGSFKEVPHSNIRRIVAAKLTEAKQTIPHFYLTVACRMDALLSLRTKLNASAGDVKISVNDLIIKAVASALREVPEVNASFQPNAVHIHDNIDISVAMQTPRGLLVPVVRDVPSKGLKAIALTTKDLGERGKKGAITAEEMQGGTFTISNLGMFGVKSFAAIINPPQACILAVGATEERIVPDGKGGIATHKIMEVTLSCDHRVVDGVLGSQFLAALRKTIEDPNLMLL
eukprot:c52364_g1_i1.p1 GENE.c52364_g1_i1~~c52364_g1_i1.p1  ORF type:complete len:507 (-),score=117.82 c52364_g1_i1:71-1591(-)